MHHKSKKYSLLLAMVFCLATVSFAGAARLAVLPLEDISLERNGVNVEFAGKLIKGLEQAGYDTVPLPMVISFLARNRIRHLGYLESNHIVQMRNDLGADLVFVGTVSQMRQKDVPTVGLSLRLIRTGDAKVVWAAAEGYSVLDAQHVLGLFEPKSVSELLAGVGENIIAALPAGLEDIAVPPEGFDDQIIRQPKIEVVSLEPKFVRPGEPVRCSVRLQSIGDVDEAPEVFIKVGSRVHLARQTRAPLLHMAVENITQEALDGARAPYDEASDGFDATFIEAYDGSGGTFVEASEIHRGPRLYDEAADAFRSSYIEASDGSRLPYSEAADGSRLPYNEAADGSRVPYNEAADGSRIPYNEAADGSRIPYNEAADGYGSPYDEATDGYYSPYDDAADGSRVPYNEAADGYGSPYDDAADGYGSPYNEAADGYGSPYDDAADGYGSPYNEAADGYGSPYNEAADGYGSPYNEASDGYGSPYNEASDGYGSPYNEASDGYGSPYNEANDVLGATFNEAAYGNGATFNEAADTFGQSFNEAAAEGSGESYNEATGEMDIFFEASWVGSEIEGATQGASIEGFLRDTGMSTVDMASINGDQQFFEGVWAGMDRDSRYPVSLILRWPSGEQKVSFLGVYTVDSSPPRIGLNCKGKRVDGIVSFRNNLFILPRIIEREPLERWEIYIEDHDGKKFIEGAGKGNLPASFAWQGQTATDSLPVKEGIYQVVLKVWDRAGNMGLATQAVAYRPNPPEVKVAAEMRGDHVVLEVDHESSIPISLWYLEMRSESGEIVKTAEGETLPVEVELRFPGISKKSKITGTIVVRDILGNNSRKNVDDLLMFARLTEQEKAESAEKTEQKAWNTDF